MKFSPVTSLLIGLVLFLPSPLSTAQQNGEPHPQLEASSPTKTERCSSDGYPAGAERDNHSGFCSNRRMRLQRNLAPVRRQNRMGRSSPYARR
jgi:hypothetical protein